MTVQTYANHKRLVPLFHAVLMPLIMMAVFGALYGVIRRMARGELTIESLVLLALSLAAVLLCVFCRVFALKAQDRAIRAEENLRHYVLAGCLLDPQLEVLQIVALRFAPDAEFIGLARRAAAEHLTPDQIKRSIKEWKPDTYRV